MCYAFIYKLVKENEIIYFDDRNKSVFSTWNHHEQNCKSLKRPADESLENEKTKAAKCSNQDEDDDLSESDSDVMVVGWKSNKEIISLKESKIEAEGVIKRLTERAASLQEQTDTLEKENADLQRDVFAYRAAEAKYGEDSDGKKNDWKSLVKMAAKEAEESAKTKYDRKLEDVKKRYTSEVKRIKSSHNNKVKVVKDKCDEQISSNNEACSKKIDKIKDKNEVLKKEMKELKAEHQKIQKQVKEEKQEQVKELKPEHSKAVKAKEATIQEKEKEIEALKKALEEEKKGVANKQDEFDKVRGKNRELHVGKFEREIVIEKMSKALSTQKQEAKQLADKNLDLIRIYDTKLKIEDEKFQLQVNKAQDFSQQLLRHQRVNFEMRNALNRRDERIEKLSKRLRELETTNQRAGSGVASNGSLQASDSYEDGGTAGDGSASDAITDSEFFRGRSP